MTAPVRQPPPFPERFDPVAPPTVQRLELDGGPTVLLAEDHSVPLVRLSWVARAGAYFEPPGTEGVASLTAAALKDRADGALARQAEALGSSLLAASNWDCSICSLQVLPDDLEPALELMAALAAPTFPEAALEQLKRVRLGQLAQRRRQPASIADDVWSAAVYGSGRYGTPQLGSEASLQRLGRDDAATFYRQRYSAETMRLTVAGAFAGAELGGMIEEVVPYLEQRRTPQASPGVRTSTPARIILVDIPGAVQTELRFGHASVGRSHPDFVRLKVLNMILGGSFSSRLTRNLRERCGFTYRIESQFDSRLGPAPFVINTSVGNPSVAAAIGEIRSEVERLQQEEVASDELKRARDFLLGGFARRFQNVHELSLMLTELTLEEGTDYLGRYVEEIRAVESADVLTLARKHLFPERAVVVAAGPAAEIREPLQALGEVVEPKIPRERMPVAPALAR